MLKKLLFYIIFILIFSISTTLYASDLSYYEVEFEGVENDEILNLLKETSQLIALKNKPYATAATLQRRAERDVSNLLNALQSRAYYGAKIDFEIDTKKMPQIITLQVQTDSVYPFLSFKILADDSNSSLQTQNCSLAFASIVPEDLGIVIDTPALPEKIVGAEEALITFLEEEGYPLAKIVRREVVADQAEKNIAVILHVESGPLAFFGETTLLGNKHVCDVFFYRKIAWSEGSVFRPAQINRTLGALEASGLFSSISITHGESVIENGTLPMQIAVTEAKHRSIAFGLNYDTDLGPGFNAEWEHRNIRGLGEKLSFVTNIWAIKKEGTLRYIKPDFCLPRQDLIWTAEVLNEETRGFDESSLSLSGTIERQFSDEIRFSYGGMFKRLRNWHSDNNRSFNLVKSPLQFMWHKTNSLLDPTDGSIVLAKMIPTWQTMNPQFGYVINTIVTSVYTPFFNDRLVLAAKAALGSIWGTTKHSIPPSERFYAGSDNLLRGYRYLTVSPLSHDNKPIGGRSMMIYSLEARMRATESFGVVAFWDIGNVYATPQPKFNHKQLQSVGIGVRYHTPVGPLRFDIAFPLNPRKHIDNRFQLYFSIGQAF